MANTFFKFKQFSVRQEQCAMKVGTDGTLLGAWANGGKTILDIGTGTGLIALMMAQRYPDSSVAAIDIDAAACRQAVENVASSPFARRIAVVHASLQSLVSALSSSPVSVSFSPASASSSPVSVSPSLASASSSPVSVSPSPVSVSRCITATTYPSIVCNPPFFSDSLHSPDSQRAIARHTITLTYAELFRSVVRLLSSDGEFSAVIPFDCRRRFDDEATFAGLFPSRICAVRTTMRKPPRRFLLAYRREPVPVETSELLLGSAEHKRLLSDFFLDTPAC